MKGEGEPELASELGKDMASYSKEISVPLSEDGGYISQDVFIGKSQELNSKGFKH